MAKACLYLRLSDLKGWVLQNSGTLNFTILAGGGASWLSGLNNIATESHLIWIQKSNGATCHSESK